MVTGPTATGKSTSLRNLPRETTAILNAENKILPFPNRNFRLNGKVSTIAEMFSGLEFAEADESIDTIVIDSISQFASDTVVAELITGQEDSRAGWMNYKETLMNVIKFIKRGTKTYIITALEESWVDDKFRTHATASVQGSLKGGTLEAHFPIVLRSMVIEEPDSEGVMHKRNVFATNNRIPSIETSAKTPMGLVDELYIDNDINAFIETAKSYFQGE